MVAAVILAVCGLFTLACGRAASLPPAPGTIYIAGGDASQSILQTFDAPTLLPQARLRFSGPVSAALRSGARIEALLGSPANALVSFDPLHPARRDRLPLGFVPTALAQAPGRIFIAGSDASGWGHVLVLNPSTGHVLVSALVGRQPVALALAPDAQRLLVADAVTRSISVLDPGTLRRLSLISLDFPPRQLLALPYGSQAFALGPAQVAALDWRRGGVLCNLLVGRSPQSMILKPDGGELYVSNAAGAVSVIDTSADEVATTMPGGAGASGMAVAPDGSVLYVANTDADTVSVLDLSTRSQIALIQVGEQPRSLLLGAGARYLFVADQGSNDLAVIRANSDPANPNSLVTLLPAPVQPRALLEAVVSPASRLATARALP